MDKFSKNIVPAKNQNDEIIFKYGDGKGLKILFAGNSVTKHAPKPEIGWEKDCGMAASSLENDYVHLFMEKVYQYDPNASFMIAQVAEFESKCTWRPEVIEQYRDASGYEPDIIIMFFGANVPISYDTNDNPKKNFGEAFEELRNLLVCEGKSTVFISQGFFGRSKLDREKRAVAEKYGDTFISLEHIIHREETHGMFNHPSDCGMKEIAETFWEVIEPTIKKILNL